jgi:hypothetical protein
LRCSVEWAASVKIGSYCYTKYHCGGSALTRRQLIYIFKFSPNSQHQDQQLQYRKIDRDATKINALANQNAIRKSFNASMMDPNFPHSNSILRVSAVCIGLAASSRVSYCLQNMAMGLSLLQHGSRSVGRLESLLESLTWLLIGGMRPQLPGH